MFEMLKTSAEADKAKSLLSLELLGNKAVGIGDHSTGDFYKNAEEALTLLVDADDRINTLQKYFSKNKFNIVIGAGSSGPDTRWGNQNYINLINQLNLIGEYFFYIQAGPNQKNISGNITNNIKKKNCIDLSDLSIREVMPFFNMCDMYVGNDSFMHHVTAQSQKPSLEELKKHKDYLKNNLKKNFY